MREELKTLTPMEKKVFDELLNLKTYKEISALINITEITVKFHSRNIYRKLNITTDSLGTHSKRLVLIRTFLQCWPKQLNAENLA